MLVSDFMSRSPVRTCRSDDVAHDAAHGVVVITAVVPRAIHIRATTHAKGQAMHIVIVFVIAIIRIVGVSTGISKHFILIRIRRFPSGVGIGILLLVGQAHQHAFPNHHIVPFLEHLLNHVLTGEVIVQALVALSEFVVEGELQHCVFAHHREIGMSGAGSIIVPIGIGVAFTPEFITHSIVETIQDTAFNVHLQVLIV